MQKGFLILSLFVLATTATGCYRMPTDQDYSLIPMTNNPSLTREKNASPVPGMGY